MRYSKLDGITTPVSEIGIGTYAVSGVYGGVDISDYRQILRTAFDLGVTLFDTAPVYADAESILGDVLKDIRKEVVISTKAEAVAGGRISYESIIASCEQSLRRLKTDYLDLYTFHFDDRTSAPEEIIRGFEVLKQSGKILTYGIGHTSLERAEELFDKGSVKVVIGELSLVNDSYYLRLLPAIKEHQAVYVGFSITGRGILTDNPPNPDAFSERDIRRIDPLFRGEKLKSAIRIREKLSEISQKTGLSVAQLAIKWATTRENVLSGLVGPSSLEHLREDIVIDEPGNLEEHLMEIDGFITQERKCLLRNLTEEIESILKRTAGTEESISYLIYVGEILAELQPSLEDEIIPVVRALLSTRSSPDPDVIEKQRATLTEIYSRFESKTDGGEAQGGSSP